MVEDNTVSTSHAQIAAARCLRLIDSNRHLCKVLDDESKGQPLDPGGIILAAYLGDKIENPSELEGLSCKEVREIVYRLCDDEAAVNES